MCQLSVILLLVVHNGELRHTDVHLGMLQIFLQLGPDETIWDDPQFEVEFASCAEEIGFGAIPAALDAGATHSEHLGGPATVCLFLADFVI